MSNVQEDAIAKLIHVFGKKYVYDKTLKASVFMYLNSLRSNNLQELIIKGKLKIEGSRG